MSLSPAQDMPRHMRPIEIPTLIDKSNERTRPHVTKRSAGLGLTSFRLVNRLLSVTSKSAASRRLQKIFETPQPMLAKPDQLHTLQGGDLTWLHYSADARLPLYSFGQGPTVLLIHGQSGRGSQMADFVKPLTEAGYRAVICDLPAHGDADGKRITFPEISKAIERIGKHLGPLHGIIAHSNGCATTSFALSNTLVVERLVYISPPEDLKAYLHGLGRYLGFKMPTVQLAEKLIEQKYGLPFDAVKGSNLVQDFDHDALIFHDGKDPLVPIDQGLLIAQHWKNSRFVKTLGLGHNKILKDPDVITTAVGFIANNSQP